MSKPIFLSIRTMTGVASAYMAMFLFASLAAAQGNTSNYILLLASGFLCDPADPSTCLATARADQGDSYEMTGAGTFDVLKKSVNVVGTFTHKSPNGNVLETGVWIASELVSFDSYGVDPGAFLRQGLPLGPVRVGPRHMPMNFGCMPTGGLAVFRIRFLPISGRSRTAVLQVNCALGNVPRERSAEGIRLTLEGNGADFSQEAGGRTMFLAMRPDLVAPAKVPQQKRGGDNIKPDI
jgi:hypothetical protein